VSSSRASWQVSLSSYAFGAIWFVLLPAALVLALLHWCESPGHWWPDLAATVRDQRVPAALLVFTVSEMVVYHFRYWLPFAERVEALGPRGLSRDVRQEYQQALQFLEQTERLVQRKQRVLKSQLGAGTLELLQRSLSELRTSLEREPLDVPEFERALRAARNAADQNLGRFRKSDARQTLESLLGAVLLAMALRAMVFEAFRIPSGSMLPTLQIGDHIFVNKLSYGPQLPFTDYRIFPHLPPARGDVMVFEFPDDNPLDERQDFVKRVIALPGDTLEAMNGHPIINGWPVPYCRAGIYHYGEADGRPFTDAELDVEFLGDLAYLTLYAEGGESGPEGPFQVGEGEVYVMGDNRNDSLDSRRWRHGLGAGVPYANIRGRASRVWLPLSRFMFPIMGHPALPAGMAPELTRGIDACLAKRPAQTWPPVPSAKALGSH
jgi:signal peptidase I